MTSKTETELIQMYRRGIKAYYVCEVMIKQFYQDELTGILIDDNNGSLCFHKSILNNGKNMFSSTQTPLEKNGRLHLAYQTQLLGSRDKLITFNEFDVLPYLYDGYKKRCMQYMKTQFLEDLVKVVCHPSRANTFEGLGFYDDE